jgi:predicted nucleic acid-binding protein
MALAKVGGLDALFGLFPKILTPPAVYEELVTSGLRLGAPDAALLQECYRSKQLDVLSPGPTALPVPAPLGPGEEQSVLLAIGQRATWLLLDDLDARKAALANLKAAGMSTQLKGTLGVILSACEGGHLSRTDAIALVEAARNRPDIWMSASLCDHVLALLGRSTH